MLKFKEAQNCVLQKVNYMAFHNKIDLLEKYCKDWGLKLNLKKIKVLIFNKPGAAVKKLKFYFQEKEIGIVNQCTYPWFTFTLSGKKHADVEKFINKTRKAWFSIQIMLNKSK